MDYDYVEAENIIAAYEPMDEAFQWTASTWMYLLIALLSILPNIVSVIATFPSYNVNPDMTIFHTSILGVFTTIHYIVLCFYSFEMGRSFILLSFWVSAFRVIYMFTCNSTCPRLEIVLHMFSYLALIYTAYLGPVNSSVFFDTALRQCDFLIYCIVTFIAVATTMEVYCGGMPWKELYFQFSSMNAILFAVAWWPLVVNFLFLEGNSHALDTIGAFLASPIRFLFMYHVAKRIRAEDAARLKK